ncbi:MAG: NAD(P)-dependent oxidoreductase [Pseudobdellovibrio sp.]
MNTNSQSIKVLVTDKISNQAFYTLKTDHRFSVIRSDDQNVFLENIIDSDALIIRSKTQINSKLLEQARNLKLIITCTSGFDHIDLKLTQEKDITVMYTPDANAQSAAELTWGLVIDINRKISRADYYLRKMNNPTFGWKRNLFSGRELQGLNYGLVGLGRIGQKVARFAQAFGMNVIVFDPYQQDSVFTRLNLQRSSYEEVLKQSQILSFHVPSTSETKNMLNRSHFEYTNPDLIVINTSRGTVINEEDLIMALENKLIAGAALDVYQKEPLTHESKLLKLDNVVLTQHMGAMTEQAFEKASNEAARLCLQYFNFNKTENTLPLVNNWGSLTFNDA